MSHSGDMIMKASAPPEAHLFCSIVHVRPATHLACWLSVLAECTAAECLPNCRPYLKSILLCLQCLQWLPCCRLAPMSPHTLWGSCCTVDVIHYEHPTQHHGGCTPRRGRTAKQADLPRACVKQHSAGRPRTRRVRQSRFDGWAVARRAPDPAAAIFTR